jgi:hypothetical protein
MGLVQYLHVTLEELVLPTASRFQLHFQVQLLDPYLRVTLEELVLPTASLAPPRKNLVQYLGRYRISLLLKINLPKLKRYRISLLLKINLPKLKRYRISLLLKISPNN